MSVRRHPIKSLIAISFLALAACGGSETDTKAPETAVVQDVSLQSFIEHPRRDAEKARDQFRNPGATLEFFEVGPGKDVAEIWPGWYTNILAPYLNANGGTYTAVLLPDGLSERVAERNAAFKDKFSDAEVFGDIRYAEFAKSSGTMLEPDSVDVILTFRNVHNWMGSGYADRAFSEFYAALKPGGILGVVEHRLPESALQDPKGSTGYVQESYMKALAKEAGFEFVASSEVNANPKDTADHPMGVWTLPPRSRAPEEGTAEAVGFEPELYKNIGESDRATLKFRKPVLE